jgi:HSP20 family molecular chaperone IbpA
MNLIPLRDDLFFPLEQVFDKFYQDFFHNKSAINTVKSNQTYPKMNVYLENNQFIMKLAVPGAKEENLEIEYKNDNSVTIRGKMAEQHSASTQASFYIKELKQSIFERSLILPEYVQGEPESAELSDGLLTLTWKLKPKKDESIKKIIIKKH